MIVELYREIPSNALVFALILCAGAGWVLDNAMRDNGAGVVGNTLLLAGGAIIGFLLAALAGVDMQRAMLESLSFAIGGAIWTLLIGCYVKSRINF